MAPMTYFFQECPTCGRHLRVRVEYLGHDMACMHCRSVFRASENIASETAEDPRSLLERAERLLALAPPVN